MSKIPDMAKKKVFITGATGNMGGAALKELLGRRDRFDIVLLARPSKKNIKKLKYLQGEPGVEIVWGDLTDYDSVLKGVTGADYVLHIGGMVSPAADMYPERTLKVNVQGARNVVNAVKAQPNRDEIGVVYIGSVAQVGNHLPPRHWGRTGDPIYTSIFDWYSVSKCLSELVFTESGLKKWVSIRQTGMLYPALLMKANDPITCHVPLRGVLEWSTLEDSGRVCANVCEDWVPDDFWRGFYNLSSGPSFRLTNYEFECMLLKGMGCPSVEKVFGANWFATKNFHGEWYLDSDRLDDILHFREGITAEDYFKRMKKQLPWFFTLAPLAPAFAIKAFMKHVAVSNPLGTLYWFKHGNTERIKAHFGSLEEWRAIPDWKHQNLSRPSDDPEKAVVLHHGYDETKPVSELDIEDMRAAARFRGGECLTDSMTKGDLFTPLRWRCQFGHEFSMTPNAVLRGGHWCPDCLPKYDPAKPNPWNFETIAAGNTFFAQVYDH